MKHTASIQEILFSGSIWHHQWHLPPASLLLTALLTTCSFLACHPLPFSDPYIEPPRYPEFTIHAEKSTHPAETFDWVSTLERPLLHTFLAREQRYFNAHTRPLLRAVNQSALRIVRDSRRERCSQSILPPFEYSLCTPPGARSPQLVRRHLLAERPQPVISFEDLLPDALELHALAVAPDHQRIAFITSNATGSVNRLAMYSLDSKHAIFLPITYPRALQWDQTSTHLYITAGEDSRRATLLLRYSLDTNTLEELHHSNKKDAVLTMNRASDGSAILIAYRGYRRDTHYVVPTSPHLRYRVISIEPPRGVSLVHIDSDHANEVYAVGSEGMMPVVCKCTWQQLHRCKLQCIPFPFGMLPSAMSVFANHFLYQIEGHPGSHILAVSNTGEVQVIEPLNASAHLALARRESFTSSSILMHERLPSGFTQTAAFELTTGRRLVVDAARSAPPANISAYARTTTDTPHVPYTVFHQDDYFCSRPRPTILYAYGAYGATVPLHLSPTIKEMLQHELQYVIAHIRGGGYLGPSWHWAGKGPNKANSVHDYLAVAHDLVRRGCARYGQIAASAKSAGAVIVTRAVMNRPELFGALILEDPLLDIENRNASDPFSFYEQQEWGALGISGKAHRQLLSPLRFHGVTEFPPTLILAASHDEVVPPSQSLKWVARLRHSIPNSNVLLASSASASHRGERFLGDQAQREAWKVHFARAVLTLNLPNPRPHSPHAQPHLRH